MQWVSGLRVKNSAISEGWVDARGMVTRCRCTECRKRFVASPRAGEEQCTCSDACRVLRRRKLARERRGKDLEGYRADERVRQRQRRVRLEAGTGLQAQPCAPASSGGKTPECHVPASALKSLELQAEIHRILDGPFRMSRAGFDL
jgi:hypothetical protein